MTKKNNTKKPFFRAFARMLFVFITIVMIVLGSLAAMRQASKITTASWLVSEYNEKEEYSEEMSALADKYEAAGYPAITVEAYRNASKQASEEADVLEASITKLQNSSDAVIAWASTTEFATIKCISGYLIYLAILVVWITFFAIRNSIIRTEEMFFSFVFWTFGMKNVAKFLFNDAKSLKRKKLHFVKKASKKRKVG